VKIIVLCGLIALTAQSAKALELKVGDRIPAVPGEAIIVGNDGGLKFQTQVLGFGQVCHVTGWIKNWLFVKRIVADWTLIELVGPSPGDDLNKAGPPRYVWPRRHPQCRPIPTWAITSS
jgi:hypothetical protein